MGSLACLFGCAMFRCLCGSTVVSAELRLRMVRYGCSGVRKIQVRYKSEEVSDTARRTRGWLDR